MDQIQVSAIFPNITPENLDEFKSLGRSLIAKTSEEEGTLAYDYFLTADETACEVREIYADSDAMLAHIANNGDDIGRLVELGGGIEAKGYGSPSQELIEATAPFDPQFFSHLGGI